MEFKPKSNDLEIFSKKYVCIYKKNLQNNKNKHLQSLLCYINRVYHCIDHPCVRKPYTAAYRLLCLSISTYLHIGGATSLTTTNTPYLIFRQTTTGRIERRALAFPFFLATVCSRQTIYDQHYYAAPWQLAPPRRQAALHWVALSLSNRH